MKKQIISLSIAMMCSIVAFSQADTAWKTGGIFSVMFNQVSFTQWAAGGDDATSVNAMVSPFANYKKGKWSWENNGLFAYGVLKAGKQDFRKNDDRIDINSKLGYALNPKLNVAYLFNFRSQFANGYNFDKVVSRIDGKDFYDLTSRFMAARLIVGYTHDFSSNIKLQTRLDLFSNYLENPQNIDVLWDIILGIKINKYISATYTTQLIYDDNSLVPKEKDNVKYLGKGAQIKQALGVGFSYNF
ncbi:MAG: DUF3078 domain-containing protein [Bacteroidetes bacterium]|nr:DUF3078 domain-containing protein [Bacteroidota bacterium]